MSLEPVPGTIYEFEYISGPSYDPDVMKGKGVFLKKLTIKGNDSYIFAEKLKYKGELLFYIYYLSKNNIKKALNENTDPDYETIERAIESPDFKHPENLDKYYLTPKILINDKQIAKLFRKQEARQTIGNFMTQVIYSPPIRNKNEKILFTGGPMYKRAMTSFTKKGGRKTRRRRNTTRKH